MSLYTGPQLIFGKKLFKNQVVFKDAVAFEKGWTGHRGVTSAIRGIGVGELHLLKNADRPASVILSGGTAESFTDVDFSSYVAPGMTLALLLQWGVEWTGDGAEDYSFWQLRPNGSGTTDADQTVTIGVRYDDLTDGQLIQLANQCIVTCDLNGIIEYRFYDGETAMGALDLTIAGYWA